MSKKDDSKVDFRPVHRDENNIKQAAKRDQMKNAPRRADFSFAPLRELFFSGDHGWSSMESFESLMGWRNDLTQRRKDAKEFFFVTMFLPTDCFA